MLPQCATSLTALAAVVCNLKRHFGRKRNFVFKSSLKNHAETLAVFVRQHNLLPCHFVAHSLGGLLLHPPCATAPRPVSGTRRYARHTASGQSDRATPAPNSAVSAGRRVAERAGRHTANIAGTLPTGIGRLFAHLLQLNDGTVALAETHLTGSVPLRVPCGHTGLLFDKTVAKHIAYFLQHGRFDTTEQVTQTKN